VRDVRDATCAGGVEGVLLSLSGADAFRVNVASNAAGRYRFVDLVPVRVCTTDVCDGE
jgi:hypothetical protein